MRTKIHLPKPIAHFFELVIKKTGNKAFARKKKQASGPIVYSYSKKQLVFEHFFCLQKKSLNLGIIKKPWIETKSLITGFPHLKKILKQ